MFFASIALTLVLSLTGAVHAAPTTTGPPQVCTGVNGAGTCTTLNFNTADSNGTPKDNTNDCTNVSGARSLIMDVSDDCETFPFADCTFINGNDIGVVHEVFSDEPEASDLSSVGTIASISCTRIDGLVNGLFPQ